MKLLNLPLLKLLCCLVVGILIGFYFSSVLPPLPWMFSALLLCLLTLARLGNHRNAFEGLALIFFILLGIQSVQHAGVRTKSIFNPGKQFTLPTSFTVRQDLGRNARNSKFLIELPSPVSAGGTLRAMLFVPHDFSIQPAPGMRYYGLLHLNRPNPPASASAFNYGEYLAKKAVYHVARPAATSFHIQDTVSALLYYAHRTGNHGREALQKSGLSATANGILQALVLGNRDELDADFYTALKNSGGAHLFALSGLHIGMLTLILSWLLRPLAWIRHGRGIRLVVLISMLWGFTFIVGASASVVRATLMYSLLSYSILIQQRTIPLNTLLSSAFLLLLYNPLFLFDAGFQLSYSALTGILLTYPLANRIWRPRNGILRWAWGITAVSIGAQAFTLPFTLLYFGQFPLTFILTNLLLTPFVMLLLTWGITISTWTFTAQLPHWATELTNIATDLLVSITQYLSELTTPINTGTNFGITESILVAFLVCSITATFYNHKRIYLPLICIFTFQLNTIFQRSKFTPPHIAIHHRYRENLLDINDGKNAHYVTYGNSRDSVQASSSNPGKAITAVKDHPLFIKTPASSLLVVDHRSVYPKEGVSNCHVLLTGSPRLHLERLIETLNPKVIIADGNNYPSYIMRWAQTCRKKNIPFHHTGEKGYYIIE